MTREQCIWCGSTKTHFDHYRCWEEDSIGNPIQVTSEEQAERLGVTIRSVEIWCDDCEGYFGWEIDLQEED